MKLACTVIEFGNTALQVVFHTVLHLVHAVLDVTRAIVQLFDAVQQLIDLVHQLLVIDLHIQRHRHAVDGNGRHLKILHIRRNQDVLLLARQDGIGQLLVLTDVCLGRTFSYDVAALVGVQRKGSLHRIIFKKTAGAFIILAHRHGNFQRAAFSTDFLRAVLLAVDVIMDVELPRHHLAVQRTFIIQLACICVDSDLAVVISHLCGGSHIPQRGVGAIIDNLPLLVQIKNIDNINIRYRTIMVQVYINNFLLWRIFFFGCKSGHRSRQQHTGCQHHRQRFLREISHCTATSCFSF